jgi:PAT family beta-lactamase induction signal transducer AmpG
VSHPLSIEKFKRSILMAVLGAYSGLPLLLVGSTLQVWYATKNIDIVTIGFLSLVGLPYLYKFVAGPVLDYTPVLGLTRLGRRRSWMALSQVGLAMSLYFMSTLTPDSAPLLLAFFAFIAASFSALQDTALDAYRTEFLSKSEYGNGSALYTTGYRVGMLLAGAVGLVYADYVGWSSMYCLMSLIVLSALFVTFLLPSCEKERPNISLFQMTKDSLSDIFKRKNIIVLLSFIVLYKIGDAFALSLISPFMVRILHFTPSEIGVIYKTVGLGSTLIGAFVGAVIIKSIGMYRSLFYLGIIQGASCLVFLWLEHVGHSYPAAVISVFTEYFCSGMGTTAFVVFLMQLCNQRYTATQFALFSALSAVGRVILGPFAGLTVKHLGWNDLFILSAMISIPGIIILYFLKEKVEHYATPTPEYS